MADEDGDWSERAAAAERAVVERHLRPVAGVVYGTAIARERWPRSGPSLPQRWHPWWQAQLLECLVDAQLRSPAAQRSWMITALTRGIRLRNRGAWTSRRIGDSAWLGVALQRASPFLDGAAQRGIRAVTDQLYRGWSEAGGGGLWWRRGANAGGGVKHAHANGPAAIMMARAGQVEFAGSIVDWMAETLLDPESGLVRDGVRVGADGAVRQIDVVVRAGAQGSYLGACVELALRDDHHRWGDRSVALVDAVLNRFAGSDGVLPGAGGGDGGLACGVLARYLAEAALHRPELETAAAELVRAGAEGAWDGRVESVGGPVFSPEWAMPAIEPRRGLAEADLSVQLGAWTLLEAAARLQRCGVLQ